MLYYAHLAEDGRKQTVDQHETGTAILSAQFAKSFSAEDHGRLVGLSHDIGKRTDGVNVSGRAHLLFSEICLITGDHKRAAFHANLVVESSNYSKEFQEEGRILLQKAEAISADQELQNSRARFDAAISTCKQLKDKQPLSYYLRLYTDITGFITEEQHNAYRQQLSELAFRIAQGCCEYHMLNYAYTYLLKADSVTSPEKDLMYAMVYARMGPHHRYLYDSKTMYYLEQGRKQYQDKLESVEMPPLNYRKALE